MGLACWRRCCLEAQIRAGNTQHEPGGGYLNVESTRSIKAEYRVWLEQITRGIKLSIRRHLSEPQLLMLLEDINMQRKPFIVVLIKG